MRIETGELREVENNEFVLCENALNIYNANSSLQLYVEVGKPIDDDTEFYLIDIGKDIKAVGTICKIESYLLILYCETSSEAHDLILKIRHLLDGKYYNGRNDEVSALIVELLDVDDGNDYHSLLELFEQYTKFIDINKLEEEGSI